jgi:hypothetical protein
VQSLTIDADGNPVSCIFTAGINGATSVDIDIRVDTVSQRVYRVSSGYFLNASGWSGVTGFISVSGFVGSVPSTVFSSGGGVGVTISPGTSNYYEQTVTTPVIFTPSSGSRDVEIYARLNGGNSSSPIIRNRFLETTELKR